MSELPTVSVRPRTIFTETGISTLAVNPAGRNGVLYRWDSDLDLKLEASKRIKELIQMAHRMAPKDKSDDFYEGLSHALSCMEQQA